MVRASQSAVGHETHGEHGSVFVLREDLLPLQDLAVLRTAARVLILANRGTLSEQVVRQQAPRPEPVPLRRRPAREKLETSSPHALDLEFWNGLGGFTPDGREYVTLLDKGKWTPAPWINVVANPAFGFQVSESGSGYTWSENSRENKLTPWSNDPVSDPMGEVIYLRDEETGEFWSPTPRPTARLGTYVIRHGQGYSVYEHHSHGLRQELLLFVPA